MIGRTLSRGMGDVEAEGVCALCCEWACGPVSDAVVKRLSKPLHGVAACRT